MGLRREAHTLWANLHDQGIGTAAKYALWRWQFSTHCRPVAWAFNVWAPYPTMLEVEISTACDLRCSMCENPVWSEPKRLMEYERFVHILDQFPRLRWIDITGIGEGLAHPRFLDMVSEIKRRGIYLELFDPFHRWDRTVTNHMLNVGLNRIQPSVDGAMKATYERIRVGSKFNTVYYNLGYLFHEKKRRGKRLPVVDFHFIVQRDNFREMAAFVRLVRELAGKQRVGVQFTQVLHRFGSQNLQVPITDAQVSEVREEARAQDVDVWFNRNVATRPKADMRRCSAWLMPFIFVDGTVVPCCAQNERNDRPWQRQEAMGSLRDKPFVDVWRGQRYQELRRQMRRGVTPVYCEGCPVFRARG